MHSQRFFWAVALKNMVNHTIIADYLVITVCLSHHRQSDVMFKLLTLKKINIFVLKLFFEYKHIGTWALGQLKSFLYF